MIPWLFIIGGFVSVLWGVFPTIDTNSPWFVFGGCLAMMYGVWQEAIRVR